MIRDVARSILAFVGVLGLGGAVVADDAARAEFFEKRVRPLLAANCFECHGEDAEESELRLDSLAGLLRGGTRGPAIVRGEPDRSLLVLALRHGERLRMPPKRKLPPAEIEAVAKWIADGAHWPDAVVDETATTRPGDEYTFTPEQRAFWAFQQPTEPESPAVRNVQWVRSPLDRFVLARLEVAGFAPAPPADRRTWLRRVTFDLTGLPPTPAETASFLTDGSPKAYERVVDRLLASPRYGERWGRHWLDVARYADSNGLDENLCHANAYRYRDYVLRAFNDDKPFDRFIREQIAGDLLFDAGDVTAERNGPRAFDPIVATAFLVIGPKMLAEDDPEKLRMDIVDEQLDTIGKAFLGMTFGCARCHDHKFDPLPTSDYYALAGMLKSTHTMDKLSVVAQWHERELATPEALAAREEHRARMAELEAEAKRLRDEATAAIVARERARVADYLLAAEVRRRKRAVIADAQPFGDRPANERPEGTFVIEAEAFDRGNVLRDTTNYGAGIGVLVNRGETPNFVEHDIEVPAGGEYRVEVRVAARDSRPTSLAINGQVVSARFAAQTTGSWTPESQTWFVEAIVSLKAGRNLVRLEQPMFFPHIDKLLFAPVPAGTLRRIEDVAVETPLVPQFVEAWSDRLAAVEDDGDSPLIEWIVRARRAESIAGLKPVAAEYALHLETDEDDGRDGADDFRALVAAADGPFARFDGIEALLPEETTEAIAKLDAEKAEHAKAIPDLPTTMAVKDVAEPADIRVHYRGDYLTQGVVVPRRFPRIIAGEKQPPIPTGRSGRLELANWIAAPENPLTPRVIVNRVWHWHFGAGIVRTPDNFGRLGERPTHPELLDWLAVQFVESGWSLKSLHREIVLSATYRMGSAANPRAAEVDPENRLLWHVPRRRLEAEAVRDGILAVCGVLDLEPPDGPPLPIANRAYVTGTANVDPVVYSSTKRSVYLPIVRSAVYDVLNAFDFADPGVGTGTRQSTTVAPQALFMMNSTFVAEHTLTRAQRLVAESTSESERVGTLYETILGRPPRDAERARAIRFVHAQTERFEGADAEVRAWQSLIRVLLSSNEFVHVD